MINQTINKTVHLNGVKTKVKFHKETVNYTHDYQKVPGYKYKVSVFTTFDMLMTINGQTYTINVQSTLNKRTGRHYSKCFYNGAVLPDNDKKIIEYILTH